ncbi:DEAD/DEAH box helicase [Cryobacterium breve]|uniref:DEAD/DEAH box helicase n=1 Tax=Cryobacterium breve TaxID=1259258 RepID=A0ABY7NE66_9MICO|nr:helicase-related protein [Cryobacterium breve]WBM79844.1 DEAD/DEAH box helicase [Cryobacterium breve]
MTATPHNGKEEDFQAFLSLLDQDRFEGQGDKRARKGTADGIMRRMVKEDLLTFEGKPLFPERVAETVSYRLSAAEANLYEEVTTYVREGMNLADRLDGKRKNTVGFALTVLQRRLASSPEAIFHSLRRRAERLERARRDLLAGRAEALDISGERAGLLIDPDLDDDDFLAEELEEVEEELVDAATAARTAAELETEVADLRRLGALAAEVLASHEDRKWVELRGVLESEVFTTTHDAPRKLIVFTEHRDTLTYLERRITTLIGRQSAVTCIHGGVSRNERRRITAEFTSNPDVQVLIATDAAGEGLNLQVAHLMVNYDLPWNPNRIEQRFGRIHRIGQTEVCRLWNLVAEDTREGDVFQRLLDKIEEQRMAYGGKVFDVLGTSLGEMSLTKLLREAIRYGELPEVRERMHKVIDEGVARGLEELLADHALAKDALPTGELEALKRQMEDARARRLQPHFVRDAFVAAFERLGGRMERRERGRFEITHVPVDVRVGIVRAPIARKYLRVTFEVETIDVGDGTRADLLAPGHPLHDTVMRQTVEQLGGTLESGAVFTSSRVIAPALLVGVFNEVKDATGESVARSFGYALVDEAGEVLEAGPAPYLDYAAAPSGTAAFARELPWLSDREQSAVSWVIADQLPVVAKGAIDRRTVEFERVRTLVKYRLAHEINRLSTESLRADDAALHGKRVRESGASLRRKADELDRRLRSRLASIDQQLRMASLPPRISAIALVLPADPVDKEGDAPLHARNTKAVERRGVDAVLEAERALGRVPIEQPFNNPGFDVLSHCTGGPSLRIEVKARIDGADTFSITRTEVLTALNAAPDHRLALVRVSLDGTASDEIRYIEDAFAGAEALGLSDFGVEALTLSWSAMWSRGRAPF